MLTQGIVSARHVDHIGMTVPDLNDAIHFFEDAIGAKSCARPDLDQILNLETCATQHAKPVPV